MSLEMPKIGFGTYRLRKEVCFKAVYEALSCGYRLIDTAKLYGNEDEVGVAILSAPVSREDVFITSKLWFPYKNIEESICESCKELMTDYIDLYMIHKPNSIFPSEHIRAFEELKKCQQQGLIRAIGVTSFTQKELMQLVEYTGIIPDLVQEECHPYFQQKKLQEKVESLGSIFQAWFPLASGDKILINDSILRGIANKYETTVPEIIMRWHIQEGHSVVVRSTNIEHMQKNLNVQENSLTDAEMEQIRTLDRRKSCMPIPNWAQTLYFKSPLGHLV